MIIWGGDGGGDLLEDDTENVVELYESAHPPRDLGVEGQVGHKHRYQQEEALTREPAAQRAVSNAPWHSWRDKGRNV